MFGILGEINNSWGKKGMRIRVKNLKTQQKLNRTIIKYVLGLIVLVYCYSASTETYSSLTLTNSTLWRRSLHSHHLGHHHCAFDFFRGVIVEAFNNSLPSYCGDFSFASTCFYRCVILAANPYSLIG